jgi:hypothetical protein
LAEEAGKPHVHNVNISSLAQCLLLALGPREDLVGPHSVFGHVSDWQMLPTWTWERNVFVVHQPRRGA